MPDQAMAGTAPPVIPRSSGSSGSGSWGLDNHPKNLSFSAELEMTFFEGQGKSPTEDEIKALINETEWFFSDLFSTTTSNAFFITHVVPIYNEVVDADHFQMTFDAVLVVAAGAAVTNMDTVADLVDAADYDEYISDYVWKSEPFQRNEFYQTHAVMFTCHPLGVQTDERQRQRQLRLLRGEVGRHQSVQ